MIFMRALVQKRCDPVLLYLPRCPANSGPDLLRTKTSSGRSSRTPTCGRSSMRQGLAVSGLFGGLTPGTSFGSALYPNLGRVSTGCHEPSETCGRLIKSFWRQLFVLSFSTRQRDDGSTFLF